MKLSSFWSTWARKAKKTPHFTLCPGYQNTQGSSSRGSCTLGTKPHLQSRTVGYSDHFIQSQDIITAGLDKEQHNINTNRAMMSSKLLQLLILCRVSCDTQHRIWLANTHLTCKHPQLNPLLWLHGRVGNAKEIKANTQLTCRAQLWKERSKSLEPHFERNLIFRLL